MLYVLFTAGARRYALEAGSVVEVVPVDVGVPPPPPLVCGAWTSCPVCPEFSCTTVVPHATVVAASARAPSSALRG